MLVNSTEGKQPFKLKNSAVKSTTWYKLAINLSWKLKKKVPHVQRSEVLEGAPKGREKVKSLASFKMELAQFMKGIIDS